MVLLPIWIIWSVKLLWIYHPEKWYIKSDEQLSRPGATRNCQEINKAGRPLIIPLPFGICAAIINKVLLWHIFYDQGNFRLGHDGYQPLPWLLDSLISCTAQIRLPRGGFPFSDCVLPFARGCTNHCVTLGVGWFTLQPQPCRRVVISFRVYKSNGILLILTVKCIFPFHHR